VWWRLCGQFYLEWPQWILGSADIFIMTTRPVLTAISGGAVLPIFGKGKDSHTPVCILERLLLTIYDRLRDKLALGIDIVWHNTDCKRWRATWISTHFLLKGEHVLWLLVYFQSPFISLASLLIPNRSEKDAQGGVDCYGEVKALFHHVYVRQLIWILLQ